RGLIAGEEWAKQEYARLKDAADKGAGFEAAFLYALDGDVKYVPPASKWLLSSYGPSAYWVALFLGGRMMIRMDPGWTQFERTYFTVPGKWLPPGAGPKWKKIVAAGKEHDAPPAEKLKVAAAELEFPGGAYNLAFQFEPAQEVEFAGSGMKFSLGS